MFSSTQTWPFSRHWFLQYFGILSKAVDKLLGNVLGRFQRVVMWRISTHFAPYTSFGGHCRPARRYERWCIPQADIPYRFFAQFDRGRFLGLWGKCQKVTSCDHWKVCRLAFHLSWCWRIPAGETTVQISMPAHRIVRQSHRNDTIRSEGAQE